MKQEAAYFIGKEDMTMLAQYDQEKAGDKSYLKTYYDRLMAMKGEKKPEETKSSNSKED